MLKVFRQTLQSSDEPLSVTLKANVLRGERCSACRVKSLDKGLSEAPRDTLLVSHSRARPQREACEEDVSLSPEELGNKELTALNELILIPLHTFSPNAYRAL